MNVKKPADAEIEFFETTMGDDAGRHMQLTFGAEG